jgi:hypothetical protein
MRLKGIIFILSLVVCCPISSVASEYHLDTHESRAVINAVKRFEDSGYKPEEYELIIRNYGSKIEVVFLPNQPTSVDPWKTVLSQSKEIHYYFDVSGKNFLRELLGK